MKTACQSDTADDDADSADDDERAECDSALIESAGDLMPTLAKLMTGQAFAPYFADLLPQLLRRLVSWQLSLQTFVPIIIVIIIDNRGLNARWCLTPLLLSLPTAAYLGQRGLTSAGLPHTTAQCHLTILGEAVLFCLNHPSFRTPGSLSFCCRPFCRMWPKRRNFLCITFCSRVFCQYSRCRWQIQ